MIFSVAVGNPPFKRDLHLNIISTIIPYIGEGAGCFVHPARWLEDPLAGYKKNPDREKFKDIVDRLEEVRIIDNKTVSDEFGITVNGELMISKVKSRPTGKDIKIYDDIARECIDVIVSYSKDHNLGQVAEKNKIDGWRVQIKEMTAIDPHIDSMREYDRKGHCNVFGMNKVNVFHDGFAGGVEWMKTRKQTKGQKLSGEPIPYSIKFRNKREAVNFEQSCNTNFYNNILYLLKVDMHTPIKFLPWMKDYTRAWTDEDYCKFFGDLGMSVKCQRWMCREVYDYRIKDFVIYDSICAPAA